MVKAEAQMRSTTSAFMCAYAATMEVLGVAGKVKYHKRFRKKGVRDVRCMFCTMAYENMEVQKQHILTTHWKVFTATVVFLINISIFSIELQLHMHMHVEVYMHYLHMNICYFLVHVTFLVLLIVEGGTSN